MSASKGTRERVDQVFEACSNPRRRTALRCVRQRGNVVLPALAEDVAHREVEADPDDECVDRVYHSLYHTHVPKLARAELVDYDRERERVAFAASASEALRTAATELDAFLE